MSTLPFWLPLEHPPHLRLDNQSYAKRDRAHFSRVLGYTLWMGAQKMSLLPLEASAELFLGQSEEYAVPQLWMKAGAHPFRDTHLKLCLLHFRISCTGKNIEGGANRGGYIFSLPSEFIELPFIIIITAFINKLFNSKNMGMTSFHD